MVDELLIETAAGSVLEMVAELLVETVAGEAGQTTMIQEPIFHLKDCFLQNTDRRPCLILLIGLCFRLKSLIDKMVFRRLVLMLIDYFQKCPHHFRQLSGLNPQNLVHLQ